MVLSVLLFSRNWAVHWVKSFTPLMTYLHSSVPDETLRKHESYSWEGHSLDYSQKTIKDTNSIFRLGYISDGC